MSNFIDITSNKYGRLTVLYRMPVVKGEKPKWMCLCDCGNKTVVFGSDLKKKKGATTSCGCYSKEIAYEVNKKYNKYTLNEDGISYTVKTLKGENFLIDLDDYDKVKDYCWSLKDGYYNAKKLNENGVLKLHRFISGAKDGEVVDHINRDKTDNRKSNLRIVSVHENTFNKSMRSDNTSGIIGVYSRSDLNKFGARIRYNRKQIHLGYFMNKEDAIKARLYGELKYFGYDFSPQRHLFEKYEINVPKTIVKEEG